jgi:hypothetical protein
MDFINNRSINEDQIKKNEAKLKGLNKGWRCWGRQTLAIAFGAARRSISTAYFLYPKAITASIGRGRI